MQLKGLKKIVLLNIICNCIFKYLLSVIVPEEVENLQFEDISDRALTVKWSPPKETNGILTHYQLKYMIKEIPDSLRVENFTADVLSTKIKHLQVVIDSKQHKIK